jgi:hypothetical protein
VLFVRLFFFIIKSSSANIFLRMPGFPYREIEKAEGPLKKAAQNQALE